LLAAVKHQRQRLRLTGICPILNSFQLSTKQRVMIVDLLHPLWIGAGRILASCQLLSLQQLRASVMHLRQPQLTGAGPTLDSFQLLS
jgi:hypothetical protein